MGHELDSTQPSFPSYAELTQTQGWAKKTPLVRADIDDAADAADRSHSSRYAEGPVLGVGGMGKVLLARDARIGRDVAVKVLHPERELEPAERARFLREAQVQGQLEHPSIVPVYDIDRRSDGTTFFTMRRVLGRTLATIIDDLRKGVPAAKTRYTQRELLSAFGTVCLAVDYAHTRGVVHRDLKPANIMLGDFGEVYILDWGLARLINEQGDSLDEPEERISMPGAFLGTPMYMSPEQMADPDVGPTADVYSLGLLLFEILTLERARDPNALYAPVEARPSVRTPHRKIAPELETICVRATEGDPKDRYSSPRAMQEAINRYLEGDRELEQRRQLAFEHVKSARIALGKSTVQDADDEQQRGIAMKELASAVAVDPTNTENVAMLADILSNPPRVVPAEVNAQIAKETQALIRDGSKHSATAITHWWIAGALLIWIGISDWSLAPWIGVPMALTTIFSVVMWRQRVVSLMTQYISIVPLMFAAMIIGLLYGPFVLTPTMLTTNAIVLQAHPIKQMRVWGAVTAVFFLLLGVLLEWTGWFGQSYAFEHGVWTIVPQFAELPRGGTFLFLTLAGVAMIIVPCAFIAKLRRELNEAKIRIAVQAWHFQRLGAQLIGERV